MLEPSDTESLTKSSIMRKRSTLFHSRMGGEAGGRPERHCLYLCWPTFSPWELARAAMERRPECSGHKRNWNCFLFFLLLLQFSSQAAKERRKQKERLGMTGSFLAAATELRKTLHRSACLLCQGTQNFSYTELMQKNASQLQPYFWERYCQVKSSKWKLAWKGQTWLGWNPWVEKMQDLDRRDLGSNSGSHS